MGITGTCYNSCQGPGLRKILLPCLRLMSGLVYDLFTMPCPSCRSVSDGHVAAGMRPMSASGERPCLKLTEHSFKGSMQGSGLEVIAEVRKPAGVACVCATCQLR
jgi:hypothetical protein